MEGRNRRDPLAIAIATAMRDPGTVDRDERITAGGNVDGIARVPLWRRGGQHPNGHQLPNPGVHGAWHTVGRIFTLEDGTVALVNALRLLGQTVAVGCPAIGAEVGGPGCAIADFRRGGRRTGRL